MRAAAIRRTLYVAYSLVFLALALALLGLHSAFQQRSVFSDFLFWAIAIAVVASISAWVFQLADTTRGWGFAEGIWAGLKASTLTLLIISAAGLLAVRALPRQVTLGFFALMPLAVLLVRIPFRKAAESMAAKRLVVVGTESEVEELSSELVPYGNDYKIVAHVNGFMGKPRQSDLGEWLEIGENQIRAAVADNLADMILISPEKLNDFELLARISEIHAGGVRVRTFGEFYEERFGKVPLSQINEAWFLFDSAELHRSTYMRFRRALDLVSGVIGTVVMGLAYLPIAAAIKIQDGGPVFYTQERVGKGGKIFKLIKFRTMRVDAENDGPQWAKPGDSRTTKIGQFLRRSRLDELPQFVNVLRGDLSLIGPRAERPEFVAQLEELIPFYSRRHLIRPGLTGWAQVSYQYGSSVEHAMEKLQYEFYYMRYQSVLLDLRIVANTARVVFSMSGV